MRKQDDKAKLERMERAKEWRAFRKSLLASQQAMAEITGISRREIQHIESGYVDNPLPATLAKWQTALDTYSNYVKGHAK